LCDAVEAAAVVDRDAAEDRRAHLDAPLEDVHRVVAARADLRLLAPDLPPLLETSAAPAREQVIELRVWSRTRPGIVRAGGGPAAAARSISTRSNVDFAPSPSLLFAGRGHPVVGTV